MPAVLPAPEHRTRAATDTARDLVEAWCDPGVAAVWAVRGGFGSQRVLDLLDLAAMEAAGPCLLVGFSDVTALHAALGDRLGVATLHAPGVAGGFASLAAVAALLATPNVLLVGWVHYLAFDLFLGAWIARRAAAEGPQLRALLPALPVTFLVGPAGLLLFLALRGLAARGGAPTTPRQENTA